METLVTITLVIKGSVDVARDEVNDINGIRKVLSDWLMRDNAVSAPYPEGSLLWYGISASDSGGKIYRQEEVPIRLTSP